MASTGPTEPVVCIVDAPGERIGAEDLRFFFIAPNCLNACINLMQFMFNVRLSRKVREEPASRIERR